MEYLSTEKQKEMIGQTVTAVGTCGMGDGVTVEGRLSTLSPPTVMVHRKNGKGHAQPYLINPQTLKLSPRVYN